MGIDTYVGIDIDASGDLRHSVKRTGEVSMSMRAFTFAVVAPPVASVLCGCGATWGYRGEYAAGVDAVDQ